MTSLAERWLHRVPTFRETSFRVIALQSDIAGEDLGEVASALETIAALAEQADERAHDVLAAAAPTLTDPDHGDRVEALREIAQLRGHFALARLLRYRASTAREAPPGPEERGTAELRAGKPLTLGERKFLARSHDRFQLDRLLRDPHPAVIRNLLENPRITEADVVRLSAKRPTYPDVQVEIAKSQRWSIRPRIRLALVQNPYTPPTIAVPLLSLLLRHEVESVSRATDLPAIVRAAALDLLERRPPVPTPDEGETH